jgi:hypothetical protein
MEEDDVKFSNKMAQYSCSCSKQTFSTRLYKSPDLAELYSLVRRYIKRGSILLSRFLRMGNIKTQYYGSRNNRRVACSGRNVMLGSKISNAPNCAYRNIHSCIVQLFTAFCVLQFLYFCRSALILFTKADCLCHQSVEQAEKPARSRQPARPTNSFTSLRNVCALLSD